MFTGGSYDPSFQGEFRFFFASSETFPLDNAVFIFFSFSPFIFVFRRFYKHFRPLC